VHQHAGEQATTFWTGCGAIRRALFLEAGGFDEQAYGRPSIEDIDLGYRLLRCFPDARIRLLKDLQVKHLKRWTPLALLRSDIVDRGVPWTRLLWREKLHPAGSGANTRDLNLQMSNRASVLLVWALLVCAAAGWLAPVTWSIAWTGSLVCALALLSLNRALYAFYARARGWPFALATIPWHWLYYAYNLVSFALGTLLARDYWRTARAVREQAAQCARLNAVRPRVWRSSSPRLRSTPRWSRGSRACGSARATSRITCSPHTAWSASVTSICATTTSAATSWPFGRATRSTGTWSRAPAARRCSATTSGCRC
jgi:hypothetical protein